MVKITLRIVFICLTCVLLNFLYHIFFTHIKYTKGPPYFVPDMELPTFIVITFVLGFIFENYLMKSSMMLALFFGLFVTVLFYSSATFIENKYSYLYEHYYKTTSYENLMHLEEYGETRDNYLTLGKALKNIGVKVSKIEGGYTDQGHLISNPEWYQKKLYYVNDDLYIIFDWDERKITAKSDLQSIRNEIVEQYGELPEGSGIRFSYSNKKISINDKNGMFLRYFVIEPTPNDTFEFIED